MNAQGIDERMINVHYYYHHYKGHTLIHTPPPHTQRLFSSYIFNGNFTIHCLNKIPSILCTCISSFHIYLHISSRCIHCNMFLSQFRTVKSWPQELSLITIHVRVMSFLLTHLLLFASFHVLQLSLSTFPVSTFWFLFSGELCFVLFFSEFLFFPCVFPGFSIVPFLFLLSPFFFFLWVLNKRKRKKKNISVCSDHCCSAGLFLFLVLHKMQFKLLPTETRHSWVLD